MLEEEEDLFDQKQEEEDTGHSEDGMYYCFNPYCKFAVERVFSSNSKHSQDYRCEGWIASSSQLLNNLSEESLEKNTVIQFKKKPIQSVLKLANIRNNLTIKLNKMLLKAKQSFLSSLNVVQNMLKLKTDQILQPSQNLLKNLRKLLSQKNEQQSSNEMISFKIQELIRSNNLKQIVESEQIILMPTEQIEDNLLAVKKKIQDLIQNFIPKVQELEPDVNLNQYQLNNMIGYICDESDDHSRVIQKYTGLFKVHPRKIYQKNSKARQYISKCALCSFQVINQFGMTKDHEFMWDRVSKHMINEHLEAIQTYYSHNVTKKAIREIFAPEIMYLLRNYSFKSVHLVFKGGRKYFESHNIKLQRDNLVLDIICPKSNEFPTNQYRFVNMNDYPQFLIFLASIASSVYGMQIKPEINIYAPKNSTQRWKVLLIKYGFSDLKYHDQVDPTLSQLLFKNENSSIKGQDELQQSGMNTQILLNQSILN